MNGPHPNPLLRENAAAAPRAAVHFLCVRRYLTVPDAPSPRPQGPLVRCPKCGKSATLPPRQQGDPTVRRFDIGC